MTLILKPLDNALTHIDIKFLLYRRGFFYSTIVICRAECYSLSVHKNMPFSALPGQCILSSLVSSANTETSYVYFRSVDACPLGRTMCFATHRPFYILL